MFPDDPPERGTDMVQPIVAKERADATVRTIIKASIAAIAVGSVIGAIYGLRDKISNLFPEVKMVKCASRVMTEGRGALDCTQSGIQAVEKCNPYDPSKKEMVRVIMRDTKTRKYLELDPRLVAETNKDGHFTRFVQPGNTQSMGNPEASNPYLTKAKFRFEVLKKVPACAEEATE